MPSLRTILAIAAVVAVSIGVTRIRGATVSGGISHASVMVTVDGAREAIIIGVPALAVEALRGPVAITVSVPPGHSMTFGSKSGAFPLAVSATPASSDSVNELVVTALASSDTPVAVQIALAGEVGDTAPIGGTSAAPVRIAAPLSATSLAAQAP